MSEKINIALCMNSKYVFPSLVCMISVLKNNPNPIVFFILYSDLSEKEISLMSDAIKKYNPSSILRPVKIDGDVFKKGPINGRAKEAYYRLLIPWFLPDDVSRCLYLDSDIIVNKSLLPYYNLSFNGKALVASEDIGEIIFFHKKQHSSLDIPSEFRYFNSGVLLFDLDFIRKNIDLKDIFSYIEKKHQHLKFLDQDVLNGIFYDKVRLISGSKYNYPEVLINPIVSNDGIRDAVFIHFFQKPWKYNYRGVNHGIWWKYGRDIFRKKYYFFCVNNFFYRKTLGLILLFIPISLLKKIGNLFK